jgi:hypothetical protein
MPRGAIATVVVGLIVSALVFALDVRGGGSEPAAWPSVESIESPPAAGLGKGGSFGLARTTLSAVPPAESGELLFRVAGVVEIDSGSSAGPATARCDVSSAAEGSAIARAPIRTAAWPRPSTDLQAEFVPDRPLIKFENPDGKVLGVPVRDSFRIFTDSSGPTEVRWNGRQDRIQSWTWSMPEGTGTEGATLAYMVVFKTRSKPRARIACRGTSGGQLEQVNLDAVQQQWPLVENSEAGN